MKKISHIIANTPLFKGLPDNQIQELHRIILEKRFKKGRIIFSEGDEGTGFYIVADGMVKVFKASSEGKEQILHIFSTGEPFGEVAVWMGQAFPASAQALTQVHLLYLPRKAFVDLIHDNPSLALNIIAILSLRIHQFTVQVENLSLKEVPGRLASYLIYLSKEQETDKSVTLSISKGQLASLLGTIPETLSRIFAKMTDQNLIEVDGRTIRFLDYKGLIQLSEQ
jgi:CRP/FNR family transcriptional regulator